MVDARSEDAYLRLICFFAIVLWLLSSQPLKANPEFTLEDVELLAQHHHKMRRMCGPLSLGRVLALSKQEVQFEELLSHFNCDDRGVTILQITKAAKDFGLNPSVLTFRSKNLKSVPPCSILILNNDSHCIVLESVNQRLASASIWDPADPSSRDVPFNSLKDEWNGVAITFGDVSPPFEVYLLTITSGIICGYVCVLVGRRSARK